ncbi:hypothetical protein Ddye_008592 [Dipteronia dyeriana]|uniref:Uncharacterized protein n=1 Tax=Dipteronia dyeriana TaxID=168575 RepID=A0AAE0CLG4_9ROSI|nr:hypothetical protein Ddye_008592 [Dipteronia dyeriana]
MEPLQSVKDKLFNCFNDLSKVGSPTEEDLKSQGHHFYSMSVHDTILQASAGDGFNDFLNTIFFSSLTVALIVAVFLDNTVDYKDSARDRGMPWWVKFRTLKGDIQNEELYILPFNINRFFPPS